MHDVQMERPGADFPALFFSERRDKQTAFSSPDSRNVPTQPHLRPVPFNRRQDGSVLT